MKFYKEDSNGEFIEATKNDLDGYFKEESSRIVSSRLASMKEKYMAEAKAEADTKIREDLKKEITPEIEKTMSDKFKGQIADLEKSLSDANATIKRKTIAAEYGFKSDMEEFLGSGTDDEMRARADKLKDGFMSKQPEADKVVSDSKQSFIKLNNIS